MNIETKSLNEKEEKKENHLRWRVAKERKRPKENISKRLDISKIFRIHFDYISDTPRIYSKYVRIYSEYFEIIRNEYKTINEDNSVSIVIINY